MEASEPGRRGSEPNGEPGRAVVAAAKASMPKRAL
jgi:hypothetical protein